MRWGLTIARLASAAWVGAAVLFVITAVREVRHPSFDSATKDALALLRFPAYYVCGFVLVGAALGGTIVALLGLEKGKRRGVLAAAWLLAVAIVLMVTDFFVIYVPMVGMITPVGRAHVAEFAGYHRASMIANVVDVGLCGIAAALLCWHSPRDKSPQTG